MLKISVGWLLLALAASAARAQAVDRFVAAPQVRLTELNGELRVEGEGAPDVVADEELPYIRSGSIVRVLSGRAEFETSYHALVRARKGDAFSFVAVPPERSRPGVVRIAAVTDGEEPSLNVNDGDKRFRIHKRGVVTVAGTGPGQSTVRTEGGNALYPAVEVSQERALLALTRGLPPGQPMVVSVSTRPEMANPPVSLASLALERGNESTFELWTLHAGENPQVSTEDRFVVAVSDWPPLARRAAELIADRYGLPDVVSANELVWNDNGPWKKTAVHRRGPADSGEVIEQSVDYDVPRGKAAAVAKMDLGLKIDGAHGEISVAGVSEDANFLAVNLAVEVINGVKTPKEARDFYSRTLALMGEGKSSMYTQGLLFPRP